MLSFWLNWCRTISCAFANIPVETFKGDGLTFFLLDLRIRHPWKPCLLAEVSWTIKWQWRNDSVSGYDILNILLWRLKYKDVESTSIGLQDSRPPIRFTRNNKNESIVAVSCPAFKKKAFVSWRESAQHFYEITLNLDICIILKYQTEFNIRPKR